MNTKSYSFDNFDIDLSGGSMQVIIWGICLGVIFGLFMSLICRVGASSLIRALIKAGACDESSAKTIDELSPKNKRIVKYLLAKSDSSIRRVVLCSNADEFPAEKAGGLKKFYYEKFLNDEVPQKTPFSVAKFYLPEENRIGAELRYPVDKRPVSTFILGSIGLIIAAVFASFAIPELLTMLDNLLTQLNG